MFPAFRFLESAADQQRQQGRDRADHEHELPRGGEAGEPAGLGQVTEAHTDQGGGDVADGRERLEQGQGERPGAAGHDLRHQGDADGELAADAHPGEEAVEGEVPDADREGSQAGADRVDEDGPHHDAGAADAVAENAEDQAAGGPADDEDGRDQAGEKVFRGGGGEQRLEGRHPRQDEQLLVHAVEQPAERGHEQDEPVVRCEQPIPGKLAAVRVGKVVGFLVGQGLGGKGVVHGVSAGEGTTAMG